MSNLHYAHLKEATDLDTLFQSCHTVHEILVKGPAADRSNIQQGFGAVLHALHADLWGFSECWVVITLVVVKLLSLTAVESMLDIKIFIFPST